MSKNSINSFIIGHNLSALVSANILSHVDYPFQLISQSFNWGGFFRGVSFNDSIYDIGSIYIELDAMHKKTNDQILNYDDLRLNESAHFMAFIRDFYADLKIDLRKISSPKMVLNGRIHEDCLLSNNLTFLRSLSKEQKALINSDTNLNNDHNQFHPSKKTEWPVSYSLDEVSRMNHGDFFHINIIEPFIQKLTNQRSRDMSAKYHRLLWVPMYYPQTILDSLDSDTTSLMVTDFYYPHNQCYCDVINDIMSNINASNVYSSTDLSFTDLENYLTNNSVWTLPLNSLLASKHIAVPAFDAETIGCVFLSFHRRFLTQDISSLFIIDHDIPFYRITNLTAMKTSQSDDIKLALEFNVNFSFEMLDINQPKKMRDDVFHWLRELNLISSHCEFFECHVKVFRHALKIPTFQNIEFATTAWHQAQNLFPNLLFSGAALPFWKHSLNDQILQGFKQAHTILEGRA